MRYFAEYLKGLHSNAVHGPAIPAATLGITALSSAFGAYSSIQSSDYQAQVARNNSQIASQNEVAALSAGAAQQQQNALRTQATLGNEKAAQASNGLDVNSGSALAVRAGTAGLGQLSDLTIRNNTARQAYGYGIAAESDEAQAQQDQAAGVSGALSDVLTGASKTSSLYTSMKQTGVITPGSFLDFSS